MLKELEQDLDEKLRMARVAKAREAFVEGFADKDDPDAIADAIIRLAYRLSKISIEEHLLIASKFDPVGYLNHVKALTDYAERFDYLSPFDLDVGDAISLINK